MQDTIIIIIIGVTVWEILTFGARPYSNLQAHEILTALQNGVRLKQPDTCTLDLYAILQKCTFSVICILTANCINNMQVG